MSDQNDKRQSGLAWLAFVFDSAIKHGVFRPADVIVHATPEVLAQHLPKELLIRTFEVAFDAGKLTPEGILGVTPPTTLVKHIAPSILWEVVRDASSRHGISGGGTAPKTGKTPIRNWIAEVLTAGLERDIYTPADVTRHIPPGEWVKDVPLEVVAKMIASGLTRPSFDPRLALEHLNPSVIGEFIAPNLSWAVIDEGAVKAFELSVGTKSVPGRPSVRNSPSVPNLGLPAAAPPPPPVVETVVAAAPPPPPPPPSVIAAPPTPPPAPAAKADWDSSAVESVDAWVDSTDMVESVETTPPSTAS